MVTITTNEIARRISELRNHKGVSAREMSLAIGQNPGYINSIENGRSYPSMDLFLCICDYLGTNPCDFFAAFCDQSRYAQLIVEIENLRDPQYNAVLSIIRELNRQ